MDIMPIPKDFSANIRESAKDKALGQIQRWIIDGTLKPGEKLMDKELSEALGVSRTPVREALQKLEMQNFVTIAHGKETVVTKIEKQDVTELYPPFAAMQALAAELAAPKINKEEIEKLKSLNTEFSLALSNGEPYKAMETDEEFHNLIVETAGNSYVKNFCSLLQMHIRRFKYLFLITSALSETDSFKEHNEIIKAFENKNPLLASDIMRSNILRPMNELKVKLQL
jgi:DNA-binding GntR family transcriptional regulator